MTTYFIYSMLFFLLPDTHWPAFVNLSVRNTDEQEFASDTHDHHNHDLCSCFYYFFQLFVPHQRHVLSWPVMLRGSNVKNHSYFWEPTFRKFTPENCFKSFLTQWSPPCMCREVQMVLDKAESSWVHHRSQNNSGFPSVNIFIFTSFPTSTTLYFPFTLANLSRQWVVGIYFHPVVVLETSFSKQCAIIKTSAKDIF